MYGCYYSGYMVKYSIIIIADNSEQKKLKRCLKAFERVNYNSFEILICIESGNIPSEIKSGYISAIDKSVSQCLELCSGEFIIIINQDFIVSRNIFRSADSSACTGIISGNNKNVNSDASENSYDILMPYGKIIPSSCKSILKNMKYHSYAGLYSTMLECIHNCGNIVNTESVFFYSDSESNMLRLLPPEPDEYGKFLEFFEKTDLKKIFSYDLWNMIILNVSDSLDIDHKLIFLNKTADILIKNKEFLLLNMVSVSAIYPVYLDKDKLGENYSYLQQYIKNISSTGMCDVILKGVFSLEKEMLSFFSEYSYQEFKQLENNMTSAKYDDEVKKFTEIHNLISEMCTDAEKQKKLTEKLIAENEGELNKRFLNTSLSCDPVSDMYTVYSEGYVGLRGIIAAVKGYIKYKLNRK